VRQDKILRDFATLPPELQQQVADFIAFLRTRYTATTPSKTTKRAKLAKEDFIGMWRNREDMHDSTAWVRGIRDREWMSRDA
jgi:hypothetical protein